MDKISVELLVKGQRIKIDVERKDGVFYGKTREQFNNFMGTKEYLELKDESLENLIKKFEGKLPEFVKIDESYKQKMEGFLKKRKLFNPQGNDDVYKRTIIKSNTTGIFNLNNVKYGRAKSLYEVMVGNFWIPEKVKGLPQDAIDYKEKLSDNERLTYDGVISFLTFLDSIQTMNLPNINDYITAPEVNLILSIQAYQEAIHSQSYATILETVVPAEKRDAVYYFRRDDKYLLERNEFIGGIYQDFVDSPTDRNFFRTLIGNFLLESLYFYNGFAFFDTMADLGKMVATQRMINYIRRDELTHVTLFANLIREVKKEFPDVFDEKLVYDMFDTAVQQEISWSTHIVGEGIMGMNKKTIDGYTKWLANERLEMLGLEPLFPDYTQNPYKHLERLRDHNMEKGNFFESTVTNYTQSSSLNGDWDF